MEPLRKAEILSAFYKCGFALCKHSADDEEPFDPLSPAVTAAGGAGTALGMATYKLPQLPLEGEAALKSPAPDSVRRFLHSMTGKDPEKIRQLKLQTLQRKFPVGSIARMKEIIRQKGFSGTLRLLGAAAGTGALIGGAAGYGYQGLKSRILEEEDKKRKQARGRR